MTAVGHVAGTPSYMAPEVAMGKHADARSDVYALGGVLYFLLTGRPPFVAEESAALLAAHKSEPVVPPSLRSNSRIDSDLEALILVCLAKSPEDRFSDGTALAEALAETEAFAAPRTALSLPADAVPNVDPDTPTAVR